METLKKKMALLAAKEAIRNLKLIKDFCPDIKNIDQCISLLKKDIIIGESVLKEVYKVN